MLRRRENQAAQGHQTRDRFCLTRENLHYEPPFVKSKNTVYSTSLTSPTSTQCSDANTFPHDDAIADDASEMMTPGIVAPNFSNKRYIGADSARMSPIGGGLTLGAQPGVNAHNTSGTWGKAAVEEMDEMEHMKKEDRMIASKFDPSAVEFIPNGNNRLYFEEGACGPYVRVEQDGLGRQPENPPSYAYRRPLVIDTHLSPKPMSTKSKAYMNKSLRVMPSPTSINNGSFLLLSPSATTLAHSNGWGVPPVIAPLPHAHHKNHTVNTTLQGSIEESAGQKYYQDLRDRGQKVLERMHNMQVLGTPKAPTIEHPANVKLNPEAPEFICTSPYPGPIWPRTQEINEFPECLSADFFSFLIDEDSADKAHGKISSPFKGANTMNYGKMSSTGKSSSSSTAEMPRHYFPLYNGLGDALFGTMW